jgi:hypothetical protein
MSDLTVGVPHTAVQAAKAVKGRPHKEGRDIAVETLVTGEGSEFTDAMNAATIEQLEQALAALSADQRESKRGRRLQAALTCRTTVKVK